MLCIAVLNCCRLLTRVLPCMFEDSDWRGFFWSSLPAGQAQEGEETESTPLAVSLINAICVRAPGFNFQLLHSSPIITCFKFLYLLFSGSLILPRFYCGYQQKSWSCKIPYFLFFFNPRIKNVIFWGFLKQCFCFYL